MSSECESFSWARRAEIDVIDRAFRLCGIPVEYELGAMLYGQGFNDEQAMAQRLRIMANPK